MNKTKLFVGIIALFSLCSLLIGSDVQPDSEWRLIETLYHVGAKPERYVLHLSGRTKFDFTEGTVDFGTRFIISPSACFSSAHFR